MEHTTEQNQMRAVTEALRFQKSYLVRLMGSTTAGLDFRWLTKPVPMSVPLVVPDGTPRPPKRTKEYHRGA